MKQKVVLDSFAVLAYLKQENNYGKIVRLLSSGDTRMMMNDINVGETFHILSRERSPRGAEHFLNVILPTLPITCISNTFHDVIEAARIKAAYPISYGDAFVVATALKEAAIVATGDPDFRRVEKILQIDWL